MPARENVNLERPARVEGDERREGAILRNDAPAVTALLLQNVAVQATSMAMLMGAGGRQFLFEAWRNKWKRIDLPMRVRHGHANHLAFVFKNLNVTDAGYGLELQEAPA